ncbi:MAG: hypothetical protein UY35_C0005G0005 [Candidatus Saccharibacteria bacterium GW2011_GWC2_48_9]|nr:MAG: hypothetical protein UY35_C0005G0005 [Candidatus Saccharibacteria bacterium GW2011_GWC2_48_9]
MGDCRKPDMKCNGRNKCNRCQGQMDRLERQARDGDVPSRPRKTGQFSRQQNDGTTLYGPKETEGRPGHKHGHRGDNFDRAPHSTIGSAALGDAHTTDEHARTRTKRW